MTSRRLLSVVLGVGLLFGTAGCSWFPDPPADLVTNTSDYEEQIRALPGVASAEAEVRPVDIKDRPGEFYVSLVVTATDAEGLATVPDLVAGVRFPYGGRLDTTLNVPRGPGLAPVTLDDSLNVERAEVLRALSIVESVRLSDGADYVQVATGVTLASAVATIRESGTLSPDPFDSIAMGSHGSHFGVAVSLAGPSDALIDYIESVRSKVDSIFSYEPGEQFRRPMVRVEASDPAPIAQSLAALAGDERDGRPRTGFDVHSDTDHIRGFVGLPLGSPEPDDARAADPTPAPVDEAALAAQAAADTESVTEFLLAAAESSGIPGIPAVPEVLVGACSGRDAQSQVQGTLLLPVFDYVDSADDAYDAITESWEADGYTHSDQAMGTSIYSPITVQPVVQASIRGTSEGIRITAMTACIG